jgi:hypothetical protein
MQQFASFSSAINPPTVPCLSTCFFATIYPHRVSVKQKNGCRQLVSMTAGREDNSRKILPGEKENREQYPPPAFFFCPEESS